MTRKAKAKSQFNYLEGEISSFLKQRQTAIQNVTNTMSNVFEAFCYILVVKYYSEHGYTVEPVNLLDGKFRFKYNTSGHPWNFSFFRVCEPQTRNVICEVRHNLKVVSAWAEEGDSERNKALFAVDIAIVIPDRIPNLPMGAKPEKNPTWLENSDLMTFGEVKKLVAYPMLLAQFLGIVHELQPQYMGQGQLPDPNSTSVHHPPPILFTDGHITLGSKKVLSSFHTRGFQVMIIANVTTLPESDLVKQIEINVRPTSESVGNSYDSNLNDEVLVVFGL